MADEMEKNKISQAQEGSEAAHAAPRAPRTPSRSRSPRGPRRPGMIPIRKFTDVRCCHQCGNFVWFGMQSERDAAWIDLQHADSKEIMEQDRHGRRRTHSTPPSSKMGGGWSVACCSRLQ